MTETAAALEALAAAAIAYSEAIYAPNINGVAARVWRRGQLMIAADAYGRAVQIERAAKSSSA